MSTSEIERETIILYNEKEDIAEVYTCNGKMKKRLKKLLKERPDDITYQGLKEDAVTYFVPKNWVKINPPRVLSKESIERNKEILKQARALYKNSAEQE